MSHEDAATFCAWAGRSLPTEAEWEYAARGGLDGSDFTWGDDDPQETAPLANTWQGVFPFENSELDGFTRTAPVGTYPQNGYGLHDMAGNVWEWTADWLKYNAAPFTRLAQPSLAVRFAAFPAGAASGWVIAGSAIGSFLGSLIGGFLAKEFGFNAVNWMAAVAGGLSVAVLLIWLWPAEKRIAEVEADQPAATQSE